LFLPVLAWSQDDTVTLLSQDDSPTLLSLKLKVHTTLESGVDHLLDVVGSRNVTQMSALIQNLVEETITDGSEGYELDGEVKAALTMIKQALLGDIRGALKEAHCSDQKELHEQILCFERCEIARTEGGESCGSRCEPKDHKDCRDNLLELYKTHIADCRALDDYVLEFTKAECPKFEKKCCLLGHTTWNCGGLCESKIAALEVDDSLGTWINTQITKFEGAFNQWTILHKKCTAAYTAYVKKDAECDCKQAECEARNCEYDSCHFLNCEDSYNKCWGRCEGEYTRTNEAKECLEKDRKIDWSATEKIECYVNVLLEKPDNQTLLDTCGSEDCYNKYREIMYNKCNDVCVEVDFEGEMAHHARREHKHGDYSGRFTDTALAPYPGYTGELSVTGTVGAYLDSTNEAYIWYDIAGLGAGCAAGPAAGVANSCGIHIHEGKTCDDASAVGGHYYDKGSVSADPWSPITFLASDGKSKGKTHAGIGAGQDINGRAIIVHDRDGGRVACALIKGKVKDQSTHQGADIDITDEGVNSVYTRHRGEGENRCTSHLDLDYQVPPCCQPCEERPSTPCEGGDAYGGSDKSSYMWLHYEQFDHFSGDAIADFSQKTCHDGEHKLSYAYNLCDCTKCTDNGDVPPAACTAAKSCRGEEYDYRQHDIVDGCETTATTTLPDMELPESNCPVPAESKACHFWGDPHFSHLFFSNLNIDANKKGGRHHGTHLVEFRPFGVFNLASNKAQSFEAQAFFCPWQNTGAPGVGAGIAMRFGDDLIQIVRGSTHNNNAKNSLHSGAWNSDTTHFFLNGKQISWEELGDATKNEIRGSQVPGTGGMTSGFMYMQQQKTTNQNPFLPVCVGNDEDTLVEVGVQSMYYQDVTIRTNSPGSTGICSTPEGKMKNADQEQYRVVGTGNLFSTRQMKHLCNVCNLDVHHERWGDTCGAPAVDASPKDVCEQAGADYAKASAACEEIFHDQGDWVPVCIMETCASGDGAVSISRIEEHLQSLMIDEE
jgi:hypothetical protein